MASVATAPPRAILVAVACVLFVAHASFYWSHAIDDAYITFRYAMNFAAGKGMVYNDGERLEGLTNLGWALVLAPFSGMDMLYVAKALGLLCGVGTVLLLERWAREQGLSLVATGIMFAMVVLVPWAPSLAMQGLETPAVMLVVTLGWTCFRRETERGGPWSSLGMALGPWMRPDAALVPVIAALFVRRADWRTARAVATIVVSALILVALKLAWFGEVLPNTFHLKTDWPPDRGLLYLRVFLTSPSPMLSGIVLMACLFAGLPGLLFLVWLAAVVLQDGDFMMNFRLLVPAWPAAAAAVGILADRAMRKVPAVAVVAVAAVAMLPAARVQTMDRMTAPIFPGPTYKTAWNPRAGFEARAGFPIAWTIVNGGRDAVSFTDIGLLAYLFDGPVIDPLGLTDRVMAGREPTVNQWSYLKGRLGYLLVDPRSGAWGRFREALADDGWMVVDGCQQTWVFANPDKPQHRPTDDELSARLATVRARAPRETWLHHAIARELAHVGSDHADGWAVGRQARCALGLDGCPRGPIGCEDGDRLQFADVADPANWPAATGNAIPVTEAVTRPRSGTKCKESLDAAEAAWEEAAAAWEGDARTAARRAANAVHAPARISDEFIRAAMAQAPKGDALGAAAIAATEEARASCRR